MEPAAPTETRHLERVVADLQGRRQQVGDAAVDAAVAVLRERIERLQARPQAPRLRQLSILFADVADSTALLQGLPADEALALLGAPLQAFADEVRAAGGEVLRFTGDGLKAAFGASGTREDEAERAVRAGLAILKRSREHALRIAASHDVSGFGVRVGVHTGAVVLGGGVEADHSAMGHAVHLAARLEQAAPVGRLRISQSTWDQVRGLFDAERQPPLRVKGLDEPITTYIVQAERRGAERTAERGLQGLSTPRVGRNAEWQALLAHHARSRAERRAQALWLVGEAGLGKTRLRREFVAHLAPQGVPVLQARSHPSDGLQPYGLVRQLLMRWLDVGDDLPAQQARERFVQGLLPHLQAVDGDGPAADAATRAGRLGHLLGLDFSHLPAVQALGPRELQEQGLLACRQLLQALAGDGGLVLVLDDLQWADPASLSFVRQLAALQDVPVLLVLLARPAVLDRPEVQAESLPGTVLRLAPLGATDGAALAQALTAAVQPPSAVLQALLVQRAAGNPFFMEELLRMLVDAGLVDTAARPWQVDEARLDLRRVPDTLVGVLQARLDRLPADALSALQQASIVGPVFWDAALAELDAEAPALLPGLAQRTLVHEQPASAFAQAREHAFEHALLHEVTYGNVLGPVRREGHARAARWMAQRLAGRSSEFRAQVAEHHARAGEPLLAWASFDRARADAMRRYAYTEALALIDRALAQKAPVTPRRHFQLLVHRTTCLEHLGRSVEAAAALVQVEAYAEQHDDDSMRADAATQRMLQADHKGRSDEALAAAQRAAALARADGRPVAAGAGALAHGELAWLALQRHDLAAVEPHLELGIAYARVSADVAAEDGGYDGYEVQLLTIRCHALAAAGRFVDATSVVRGALAALENGPPGQLLSRLYLLCQLATLLRSLGDVDAAAREARSAVDLAAQFEMPRARAVALEAMAEVAWQRGDLDELARVADEVDRISAQIRFAPHQAAVCQWRATLALGRGDVAAAVQSWERAAAELRAQHRPLAACEADAERAALLHDEPALALSLVDAALAAARERGDAHHGALAPRALLACRTVLARAGDARLAAVTHDLQARLQRQLAQLPDAAARQRLLHGVPHWAEVAAWPAAAAAGGAADER